MCTTCLDFWGGSHPATLPVPFHVLVFRLIPWWNEYAHEPRAEHLTHKTHTTGRAWKSWVSHTSLLLFMITADVCHGGPLGFLQLRQTAFASQVPVWLGAALPVWNGAELGQVRWESALLVSQGCFSLWVMVVGKQNILLHVASETREVRDVDTDFILKCTYSGTGFCSGQHLRLNSQIL